MYIIYIATYVNFTTYVYFLRLWNLINKKYEQKNRVQMFAEMTLAELNALAERQRRQIEDQEKSLQAKQQRLSFLTQQSQQHGKLI